MATGRKPRSYKSGMIVRHDRFGRGIVTAVEEREDHEIVTVRFSSVGTKRLHSQLAPMQEMPEEELLKELEDAISCLERAITWLEKGWDCIEEEDMGCNFKLTL